MEKYDLLGEMFLQKPLELLLQAFQHVYHAVHVVPVAHVVVLHARVDEDRLKVVFITEGPVTKLFAGGGGGEWRTCAMRDDEPRPV